MRTVRIRLTGPGLVFVGLALAMGVVAVNSGNNLLYLAVAGLLALLFMSGVLALLNLKRLRLSLGLPEEVYAGRPVTASLRVTNGKRLMPSFLLTREEGGERETITEIRPGDTAELPVRVLFPARGRHRPGGQLITSPFPFGLVVRGGIFEAGGECLVFPAPLKVPWELLESAEQRGDATSSIPAPGVGGDYRGVREYAHGDPISRVHWKEWLRRRELHTKEFDAEGSTPVILSFDEVPGPGTEQRLGQLTWLVRTAMRRGRAVGLKLPGLSVPPGSGRGHRRHLLSALALHGKNDAVV